jgi:hypothetical protein
MPLEQSKNSDRKTRLQGILAWLAPDGLSPLLLQFLEAAPRPVAEAIKRLDPALYLEKASVLPIKFGLVELLQTLQHVLEGFRGVDEDGPFAIADGELMHGLVAMDLPRCRVRKRPKKVSSSLLVR